MDSIFVRYRNVLVLLVMLLAQIIGLAMQVRRTNDGRGSLDVGDGSGVRLIRLWAQWLVAPPERLIHSAGTGSTNLWQNYIDLRNVRQQNADLQKTIDRLRLEQASMLEDAKQGQRLQALLDFQQKYIYQTVAAQVIGSSGSEQSRVFYIDKGSANGLARDNAVITADGIVGKVRDVFPHSAQVLAINDQTSGAGVILETTRTRGILRGNANGQTEVVDILADKRIQKGEVVLTAGGDQIFPRGLPVGVVDKVIQDPERDSFIIVMVTPAARLDRLDEVLVITNTLPHFSSQQQQDIAASEALKGPEAAAIKAQQAQAAQEAEQKKASEIMAERLPGLIDPNLPADQQPLHDSSNPNRVDHPPQALHPDRFSPGGATSVAPAGGNAPDAQDAPDGAPAAADADGQAASASSKTGASSKSGASQAAPGSTPAVKPKTPAKPAPKPQENR